ncbi:hypothetical protein [Bacillus sp. PS06]|uniref:hypothetical protein n=1 Tax=Bacillus sp. PS06 TaxID=2764176 RepID=UPI00177EEF2A|nr:hypothetical protein [Bacillus sp. PS06]MBD8068441.1 hypothetical protein [Bacillus sp. PS06]
MVNSIQDALYNWLTIKVVAEARPDDHAAIETYEMFEKIVFEDHGVSRVHIRKEEPFYYVTYMHQGEEKKSRFPIELIDVMHDQIKGEPEKYINYE